MNKKLLLIIQLVISILFTSARVEANEITLEKGYATAYCLSGVTASGEQVREGICASCESRLGKTIILYQRLPDDSVGSIIGIYECKDTGGTRGIKSGNVIDVWMPNLDSCQEFMNLIYEDDCQGKVWIQVINSD